MNHALSVAAARKLVSAEYGRYSAVVRLLFALFYLSHVFVSLEFPEINGFPSTSRDRSNIFVQLLIDSRMSILRLQLAC